MCRRRKYQTKLVNSLMSNDYFDLYFSAFSPALILGGYVEPFEIDMDNALWADVQDENEQFMWKGEPVSCCAVLQILQHGVLQQVDV